MSNIISRFLFYPFQFFGLKSSDKEIQEKRKNTLELLNNNEIAETTKLSAILQETDKYIVDKEMLENHIKDVRKLLYNLPDPQIKFLLNYLESLIIIRTTFI